MALLVPGSFVSRPDSLATSWEIHDNIKNAQLLGDGRVRHPEGVHMVYGAQLAKLHGQAQQYMESTNDGIILLAAGTADEGNSGKATRSGPSSTAQT